MSISVALPKPLERYKAVFFDVGDTLVTIPEVRAAMKRYFAGRSIDREEEQLGELFNEAFRLFYYEKPVGEAQVCTPDSDRAFWVTIYRYMLDKLDVRAERWTEEDILKSCHELYDLFTSPEQYALFEDVEESLAQLKSSGLQLGVISNFAPTLKSILRSKGILHYFDPVIVSTEVGLEKPNPDIFRVALKQAGLQPEEVLYVGDHDINDIWAPNQIGMDAVKIKRYSYHTGEGIRSLRQLLMS